jgi:hypothetical protein
MIAMLDLLGTFVANLFKSRRPLELENLFLRHQLNIALRHAPHRLRLGGSGRALLVWVIWFWPSLLGLSGVVQRSCVGIEPGFATIGAGNLAADGGGRESAVSCASSFGR